MKKYIILISLVFVVVIVGLYVFFILRSIHETVPTYRFLDGYYPVSFRDVKTGSVDKLYIYSFEADFNDVCSKANAELTPAGFVDRTLPPDKSSERRYWLKGKFPRGPVDINIHNNYEHIEHPISKKGGLGPRKGWVVVEIAYWRNWW